MIIMEICVHGTQTQKSDEMGKSTGLLFILTFLDSQAL